MVGDRGGLITLAADPLSLTLCPEIGGSIARFDYHSDGEQIQILRGCDGLPRDVLGAASFPLVPFVNRIRGGEFAFQGQTVRLAPNMAGDPSPLHGQGWLAPWDVVSVGDDKAHLQFEHSADEWPWSYIAEQRFALTPVALDVTLSCTNRSASAMPCGLGQHPYFHCGSATMIEAEVAHVWLIDELVLPTEMVAAEGRYDLSRASVCGMDLDHGFGGWGGTARLSDPSWPAGVVMSSPDAAFFQLYSPRSEPIFVAEPVTHANAALNAPESRWPDLGMRVLEPGQSMSLHMRIAVN
ncbi:MAG: aldose 1-epimerase [Sphingomicrobium sp.]